MPREFFGGYCGQILRVDLSHGTTEIQSTDDYLPEGIGGRGIAALIAWQMICRGMSPWDPRSPLILMTGPLTGTMAPFSGRTTLCGLAPQGYPHEWYTRSSFGGHFGPELKYAGFDGIVITGRADKPVYLKIENDRVSIESARDLWGLGLIESQRQLIGSLGPSWRIFAIGPAGENLSRIAIAATETESASGQGGFGAVMGAKQLKAIAVKGTRSISIADPTRFETICKWIREEAHGSHGWPHTPRLDPDHVKKYGQKFQACTQSCTIRCFDARYYQRVPSKLCPGKHLAGQIDCIAGLFPGVPGSFYDWDLGFEAGFEISQIANDEGINHWEILVGLMPWLRKLKTTGELTHIDDMEIDLNSQLFWVNLFRAMSRRSSEMAAILAEGTVRASNQLGIGSEALREFYPCWGYAGHWDGHGDHINRIFFPFWIVSAIQWAVDSRDPISSGHGYVQNMMGWCREHSPVHGIDWDYILEIGERLYGTKDSVSPTSGYEGKAFPAFWHGNRSVMKDSLPLDDQVFPRIFSKYTPDHFARAGDLLGTQFEHALFTAATGISWSEAEFEHYSARTIHVERQLLNRLFDRSRQDDETIIPYLETPENLVNPYIGERMKLDSARFRDVLTEYYRLRGWDPVSGLPTQETIDHFKLPD